MTLTDLPDKLDLYSLVFESLARGLERDVHSPRHRLTVVE